MKEKREKNGICVRPMSRIEDGKKLCMCCNEMKELSEFSPSTRGLGGIATYCKPCIASKYKDKEKAKAATSLYRKRNRERHLANHRVRMFEYRTKKKVTSDGTVTDELLKSLYAEPACYYCGEDTPSNLRTIDHKIPLSKGGGHVADNLVMACWSCNCSKRDLNEIEFLRKEVINDH